VKAVQDFIADEARLDKLEDDVEVISLNMKVAHFNVFQ
jgi:hypothetical protein